jgi:meso-butanediol dehydrogenase/(S,S)-butanediol dehydrogenase/diacetyl reductase
VTSDFPALPISDRYAGKVAVITGAASGIGRATTVRLASEGATVVGVDVNAAGLDATAKQVAETGGTFVSRTADVTSRDACHQLIADTVRGQGRLDVLGNVAGVLRMSHFTQMSEEDYRLMMGVNIDGYVWLSQAAIPHLIESTGNIVNIASNAGMMGQAYTVAYCANKGAVVNFTKALAMEFMKTPIRVNAIAPAGTLTALSNSVVFPDDPDWKLVGRYTGLRDMATPEDIAALFAFLASSEARNIHGAILSSDGGVTAG